MWKLSDTSINDMMTPWKDKIDVKAHAVLGRTMVTLSKSGCYYKECTLGNFVADAFVFYVSLRKNMLFLGYAFITS